MRLWLSLIGAAITCSALSAEALGANCVQDNQCKAGRVCFEGKCKRLKPDESLLRVELAQPIQSIAALYIDESYVGVLPWSGIVPPGEHALRVEAEGYLMRTFQGQSRAEQTDTLHVELQPIPVTPPPVSPAPAGTSSQGSSDEPGMLYLGLLGGFSYGTASWDSERRPAMTLLGGGAFGVRIIDDPVWLELGVAPSLSSIRIEDWIENWGKFIKFNIGLQVRLMFEVIDDFVLIGAELEPGYGLSNRRFAYLALRFAASFLATEWLEFRVNLGGAYDQELRGKGWIGGGQITAGVAFRFLNL